MRKNNFVAVVDSRQLRLNNDQRRKASAMKIAVLSSALLLTATIAAAQRLPDGRPDLNGTWIPEGGGRGQAIVKLPDGSVCVTNCAGLLPPAPAAAGRGAGGPAAAGRGGAGGGGGAPNFPKYKPEYLAKVKVLDDNQVKLDTLLQCQAPGVPRIGPPDKIVQTAKEVVFLYDDGNGAFFRIIPTDGRGHRPPWPSYLGDAIARWEGDTLVVETLNFNEDTWLADNGAFHTKDLKVVERLRRTNLVMIVGEPTASERFGYKVTAPDAARSL